LGNPDRAQQQACGNDKTAAGDHQRGLQATAEMAAQRG
jgi:hypothetical protein